MDKHGIRQDQELLGSAFFETNALTVVAGDSYDDFASSLQKEILASLSRETKISVKVLSQITLKNEDEMEVKIGEKLASKIMENWKAKGYLGEDGFVTDKAIKDIKNKTFEVIPQLEAWKKEVE